MNLKKISFMKSRKSVDGELYGKHADALQWQLYIMQTLPCHSVKGAYGA
jgi:hypothetical protein